MSPDLAVPHHFRLQPLRRTGLVGLILNIGIDQWHKVYWFKIKASCEEHDFWLKKVRRVYNESK